MLIKEEIIADVYRFMFETGLKKEDMVVVGRSAATVWGILPQVKHVEMHVTPEAYDHLYTHPWVEAMVYCPKLIGETTTTNGLLSKGKYTVLSRLDLKDTKVQEMEGVPICGLEKVLETLDKRWGVYPYRDAIRSVMAKIEDLDTEDLGFIRKVMNFDRYYQYSDDINVYRNGKKAHMAMLELIEKNDRFRQICEILNDESCNDKV